MACKPCAARAANRPLLQVKDATGRVVYEHMSPSRVEAMVQRYPGGWVVPAAGDDQPPVP